jgi:formate-dependent nitrite reductase membrane component NrfD
MVETVTTRHNPLIDPQLSVWSWEIPVYLFLGGVVAGLMILAGIAMLRTLRGEDTRRFLSVQTPLLSFVLINVGMLALWLDLAHRLYVWRVYLTFQPASPMSWGSWVLIVVYAVLLVSALYRLPESWPWLAARMPIVARASDALAARPNALRALAWTNVVLGAALGLYTGILLSTMVARPLWNTGVLAPLFLLSGLSAAAAVLHLIAARPPRRRARATLVGGALASLAQPLGDAAPEGDPAHELVRADVAFIAVELALIALLLVNLATSTPSHASAAAIVAGGRYAPAFWGIVVVLGLIVPLAMQLLALGHRIAHSIVPAVLVLVGGFTLRWVLVHAGQAAGFVQAAAG